MYYYKFLFKKYFLYLNFKKKLNNSIKIYFNKFKKYLYIFIYIFISKLILNKFFIKNNYINVKCILHLHQLYFYTNYFIFFGFIKL